MSELQNDGAAAENEATTEASEVADQNTGADLATASENDGQHEEQAQVDPVEAANKLSQDAINKQHGKFREQERRADGLQSELDDIKRKQQEQEAARVGELPPIPDQLDDDYDEKMRKYTEGVANKAAFDEKQKQIVQNQQNQQEVTKQQEDAAAHQAFVKYSARAVDLDIGDVEMNSAINTVLALGLTQDSVQFLVDNEIGPLMTKHLAGNVSDINALAMMPSVHRGAYLQGLIPKAELLRPKTSNTPAPVDNLSGNGAQADANKFKHSKGATFT